jgi:hypothetical protein
VRRPGEHPTDQVAGVVQQFHGHDISMPGHFDDLT